MIAVGLVGLAALACSSNSNNNANKSAATSVGAPAASATNAATRAAATAAAAPAGSPAAAANGSPTSAPTVAAAPGAIKITFWHGMSGTNGEAVQALVNKYNSSQQKVHVDAVYEGSYDDGINKLREAIQTKTTPNMMQVYDIGTRFMIDSKAIVPMQSYIDKDKFDLSTFEQNVLGYYKVGSTLYSMPWNSSNPLLYYNKDLFKAAGLDPDNPPKTWEEVADAAKKLSKGDVKGIALPIDDWYFEQTLATQGALFATADNGRTDKPADKAAFNGPEGVGFLGWWAGMIKDGIAANLGRNSNDTKAAFAAQKIGMVVDSTAALRQILNSAQGKYEVGTAFFPRPANNPKAAGTIIGGASLWIMKDHPQAEQDAAWDFIKFLMQPEQLAYWHINTGYYPPSKAAYDVPADKEWVAKYPQFKTAVDQLHAAPLNTAMQGALLGVFVQARQDNQAAFESVFAGQATPQQALDKSAATISDEIKQYNQAVPH
jgi:sn-glycerol 3-phosphate transport system substrate-binding protein